MSLITASIGLPVYPAVGNPVFSRRAQINDLSAGAGNLALVADEVILQKPVDILELDYRFATKYPADDEFGYFLFPTESSDIAG